jgi:hypothetical protein
LLRFLREEKGSALSDDEVMKITKEHFDTYRMSLPLTSGKSNTRSSSTITNPSVTNSDVKDFIKGNKDKTQYDLLKDERQFDTWYLSFLTMARSHKITNVLDESYVPSAEDKPLFDELVSFTYTVLHHTLKTDMGITLVKKHHRTGDAQKLWSEFISYMKKSTKAQIASTDILSWITSARYDSTWRGTTQTFVLYWLNRVLEYDSYCTTTTMLNDEVKLQLLQNAVKEVTSL